MADLYQINENIEWLHMQAEMIGLESNEGLEEQLEQLDLDREEKIEEYVKIIKNLEADAEQFKAAYQEFQKKKLRAEKNAKYLRDQIKFDMEKSGESRKRVGHFTVDLANTQGKVVVTDEDLIPEKFKKVKVEVSKVAIKEHMSNEGEIPPGVTIENGVRLSIR